MACRSTASTTGTRAGSTCRRSRRCATFQKDDEAAEASVANPLDDGSFVYAVRAAHVRVGETRRDDRYVRPDRNPVVLTGLRHDTVTVNAGTLATTVVRPSIPGDATSHDRLLTSAVDAHR